MKRNSFIHIYKFYINSTQTFYIVNTTFEMGCMVTNVTVYTWQTKKNYKKHIIVTKCEWTLRMNKSHQCNNLIFS